MRLGSNVQQISKTFVMVDKKAERAAAIGIPGHVGYLAHHHLIQGAFLTG